MPITKEYFLGYIGNQGQCWCLYRHKGRNVTFLQPIKLAELEFKRISFCWNEIYNAGITNNNWTGVSSCPLLRLELTSVSCCWTRWGKLGSTYQGVKGIGLVSFRDYLFMCMCLTYIKKWSTSRCNAAVMVQPTQQTKIISVNLSWRGEFALSSSLLITSSIDWSRLIKELIFSNQLFNFENWLLKRNKEVCIIERIPFRDTAKITTFQQ